MKKYKICNYCHIAFDEAQTKCPSCGREIEDDHKQIYSDKEGDGRIFRAGGAACDYCPHCYGSADWCPMMGD